MKWSLSVILLYKTNSGWILKALQLRHLTKSTGLLYNHCVSIYDAVAYGYQIIVSTSAFKVYS